MRKVTDNDAVIIRVVALEPHAITTGTTGIQRRRVIDANVDLVALNLVQAVVLRGTLVNIGDITMSRIRNLCPS